LTLDVVEAADQARLVAGLRRVGMPVAGIVAVLGADRAAAHGRILMLGSTYVSGQHVHNLS
jgi:hypothetical protein